MTLDEIHNKIDFVAEKERAGFFNPERKDMALDMASMNKFKKLLPVFGLNEVVSESLTPFKRPFVVTNSNSPAGLITLPSDYEYLTNIIKIGFDNANNITTYYDVEFVNDDELADRLRSQMKPVTPVKPIAQRLSTVQSDGTSLQLIQLYPKVVNACTINYLARPNKPVYAYTQDDPDGLVITYNAAGSTQLNWKETDIYDIIFGALTILGVNLDDDKLAQYGMMLSK